MTGFDRFKTLFRTTLTDPRQAGLEVIAMQLPMQGLWIALMLMAVLLSLMVSALFHAAPLPPDEMGQIIQMSPAYQSPLFFALINWGQAVISVFVLYWIGQMLGGQGTLADMLAVMIWLQVVSLVLAVTLFFVGLVLPMVGGLMMICVFFWGLWAMIGLVDAAHRFNNMFRAFGVCVVALVAFMIGMTLLSAVIGGLAMRGG